MARVQIYRRYSSIIPIFESISTNDVPLKVKEEKLDESESNPDSKAEEAATSIPSKCDPKRQLKEKTKINKKIEDQVNDKQKNNSNKSKSDRISIAQHYINITNDSYKSNNTDNVSDTDSIILEKDINRSLRQRDLGKQKNIVECDVCSLTFVSTSALSRHKSSSKNLKILCYVCRQTFDKTADLVAHRRSSHRGYDWSTYMYKCHYCTLAFNRKKAIIRHIHHFHDINRYLEISEKKSIRRQKGKITKDNKSSLNTPPPDEEKVLPSSNLVKSKNKKKLLKDKVVNPRKRKKPSSQEESIENQDDNLSNLPTTQPNLTDESLEPPSKRIKKSSSLDSKNEPNDVDKTLSLSLDVNSSNVSNNNSSTLDQQDKLVNPIDKSNLENVLNEADHSLPDSDSQKNISTEIPKKSQGNLGFKTVYRSSLCKTRFSSQKKLIFHYLYFHTDQRLQICPVCEEPYESFKGLKSHLVLHCIKIPKSKNDRAPLDPKKPCTTRVKFPCDKCKKVFFVYECLERHKLNCKGLEENDIPNNDLEIDDKQPITNKVQQKKYINITDENDIESRTCHVCNTIFRNRLRYIEHSLYYYNDISIGCSICNEIFLGQYEFHKHKKEMHFTEDMKKTFNNFCTECNEGFEFKSHLFSHIHHVHKDYPNRHLMYTQIENTKNKDDELHNCNICDENFNTSQLLAKHLLEYSNYGSYKCKDCNRIYLTEEALTDHIKSYHGNNHYLGNIECPVCHEVILFDSSPISHIKHHHYEIQNHDIFKPLLSIENSNTNDDSNAHFAEITIEKSEIIDNSENINNNNDSSVNFDDVETEKSSVIIENNENTDHSSLDKCDSMIESINAIEVNDMNNLIDQPTSEDVINDDKVKIEYTCAICDMKFLSRIGLKLHGSKHNMNPFEYNNVIIPHNDFIDKLNEDYSDPTDNPLASNCEIDVCNTINSDDTNTRESNLSTNKNEENSGIAIENICSVELQDFENSSAGNQPINAQTNFGSFSLNFNNISSWKCNICLEVFSSIQSLDNHSKTYSNSGTHQCEVCQRRFILSKHYQKHRVKHKKYRSTTPNNFCALCNEAFATRVSRKIHFAHIHGLLLTENGSPTEQTNLQNKTPEIQMNLELSDSPINRLPHGSLNTSTQSKQSNEIPTSTSSPSVHYNTPNIGNSLNCANNIFDVLNFNDQQKQLLITQPSNDYNLLLKSKFFCEQCGLKFSNSESLKKHSLSHKTEITNANLELSSAFNFNIQNNYNMLPHPPPLQPLSTFNDYPTVPSTSTVMNNPINNIICQTNNYETLRSLLTQTHVRDLLNLQKEANAISDAENNPKSDSLDSPSNDINEVQFLGQKLALPSNSNYDTSNLISTPTNSNTPTSTSDTIQRKKSPSDNLKNLIVSQGPVNSVSCRICNEKFSSIHILIDHCTEFHNVTLNRLPYLLLADDYEDLDHTIFETSCEEYHLQCYLCNTTYESVDLLRSHCKFIHGVDKMAVKYVFNKRLSSACLSQHNHGGSVICQICDTKLPNEEFLKMHVHQVHYFTAPGNKEPKNRIMTNINQLNQSAVIQKIQKESTDNVEVIEILNEKQELLSKLLINNPTRGSDGKSYHLVSIPGNKLIVPEKFSKKRQ